jgi:tetratricopeptide (TPR) repeat protein
VAGWLGYLLTTDALEREELRRDEAEANVKLSLDSFEEIFDNLDTLKRRRSPGKRKPPDSPHQPEAEEEDAALLQSIVSFHDRFAASNETNPRLQLEAAKAHRRVGMIRERMDESEAAQVSFARAIAILEKLAAEYPDDPECLFEIAETYPMPGMRATDPDALAEADRRCRQAFEIARDLAERHPDDRRYAESQVSAHARHSSILARLDRADEARASLEEALRLRDALIGRYGAARPSHLVDTTKAREELAALHRRQDRLPEARRRLEEAIEEIESWPRPSRRGRMDPKHLSRVYRQLADVLEALGKVSESQAARRKAREVRGQARSSAGSGRPPGVSRGRGGTWPRVPTTPPVAR